MLGAASLEAISGGIKLSAFTGLTPVAIDWEGDYTAFKNIAPQLQIWNGSDYDMAYYVSNAWLDDGTEDGQFVEGWCDMDGILRGDDYAITPGYAYWLKNVPDSNPLNVAGQVKKAEKVQVSCPNAFMLVGNPYPTAIKLNGGAMTSTDITPVAIDWDGDYTAFKNFATQLQIWDGVSDYDMAYYVSNAWLDDGTEDGQFVEGWCDMDGILRSDYYIPVGIGFWIKATSGACTLDFANPIK